MQGVFHQLVLVAYTLGIKPMKEHICIKDFGLKGQVYSVLRFLGIHARRSLSKQREEKGHFRTCGENWDDSQPCTCQVDVFVESVMTDKAPSNYPELHSKYRQIRVIGFQ